MTKKNTKTYDYIVNISDANSANDIYLATAIAKIDKTLTYDEIISLFNAIEDTVMSNVSVTFVNATKNCDTKKPKKSWFRRILDWIKGK